MLVSTEWMDTWWPTPKIRNGGSSVESRQGLCIVVLSVGGVFLQNEAGGLPESHSRLKTVLQLNRANLDWFSGGLCR